MSDFTVPVVRIGKVEKHRNADTLSLTEVEGCPVIFRTVDFKEGDLAVYLPIESMIPEDYDWVKAYCSHLKFKGGFHRLKAVRLRGIFSMGMLVPYAALSFEGHPPEWPVGDDVAGILAVDKYEEPEEEPVVAGVTRKRPWHKRLKAWLFRTARRLLGIKPSSAPPPLMPVYSVDYYRKSKGCLQLGAEIVATEKIHGCNEAVCFINGQLYVSSHRALRPVEDESIWWKAARIYGLEEKLKQYPNHAFYGEVYGPGVQDMEYDVPPGELRLRFFDIMDLSSKRFFAYDEALAVFKLLGLDPVPEVYRGPYDPAVVEPLSDGKSMIASHFREGVVIRTTNTAARIVLKLVGEKYLLRKGGTEKH